MGHPRGFRQFAWWVVLTMGSMLCAAGVGWLLTSDIRHFRWVFPAAGLSLAISGLLFRGIRGGRGSREACAASRRRIFH